MKASARANLAASFTVVNGVMIDMTHGVFPGWVFARSKRENLDRLPRENSLDLSADIMEYIAPIFFGDANTAETKVLGG